MSTEKININQWIVVLLFGTSLFAASIITIDVSGFKMSFFRLLILLALFLFVLPSLLREGQRKCTVFMLLWLMTALISGVWVSDREAWFKDLFFLVEAFVMVAYFQKYVTTKSVFIKAARLFSFFVFVHNCIGYYEMFTHDYHWVSKELAATYTFIHGKIPVSVFFNSNNYATVLLLGIAFLTICLKNTENFLGKAFYIFTITSSIYQMICSLSRANVVALIAGIIILFVALRATDATKIISIILGIFLSCLVIISPLGSKLIEQSFGFLDFNISNGSEALRVQLLNAGWKAFSKSFGFGVGAGNLPNIIASESGIVGGKLHLWWLEVLFSYGIIVFTGYLYCYFNSIKKCFARIKKRSFTSAIFFSFLIVYLIGACSSSSVIGIEPLWAGWAMILAYINNYDKIEKNSNC